MNLLKRAEAMARKLKKQGCTEWPNRLEDAVRGFERRFQPQPEVPAPLTELNSALDDLSLLPEKIALLKKETLQREAETLEQILEMAAPFIHLLDDSEPYYRRSITILAKSESFPFEEGRRFCSEVSLILYENGLLTRSLLLRETCADGIGWERREEEEIDCASAVSLYGLEAITSGLAAAPKELPSIKIMHRDLEKRLAAITNILEALRRTP
jgi:hypothetical protein